MMLDSPFSRNSPPNMILKYFDLLASITYIYIYRSPLYLIQINCFLLDYYFDIAIFLIVNASDQCLIKELD